MAITYLTNSGVEKLKSELDYLRNVKRFEIAALLKETHGTYEFDGDNDPEFAMFKDQQAFIEGRIYELEVLLSNPIIIDQNHHSEVVEIGSQVMISENDELPVKYLIVGPTEADPVNGLISFASPLGSAMLGHRAGDDILVRSPGGLYTVKILEIS